MGKGSQKTQTSSREINEVLRIYITYNAMAIVTANTVVWCVFKLLQE